MPANLCSTSFFGIVVTTVGLEAELAAAGSSGAQSGAFTDAVAVYCNVDGEASLGGLLAYLDAERAHGVGLDQAVASDANSVKLLTVHKAKGLEWHAVFLPGMADGVFPNERVTDNWVNNAGVLPAELRGDAAACRSSPTRPIRRRRTTAPPSSSRSVMPRTGWPTWRSPGQSNCWWPAATPGRASWCGPGRRRRT